MENYKDMYYSLFNKITEVIDELRVIQQVTEEMYIIGEKNNDVIIDGKIVS